MAEAARLHDGGISKLSACELLHKCVKWLLHCRGSTPRLELLAESLAATSKSCNLRFARAESPMSTFIIHLTHELRGQTLDEENGFNPFMAVSMHSAVSSPKVFNGHTTISSSMGRACISLQSATKRRPIWTMMDFAMPAVSSPRLSASRYSPLSGNTCLGFDVETWLARLGGEVEGQGVGGGQLHATV
jgi:hypothetical protein